MKKLFALLLLLSLLLTSCASSLEPEESPEDETAKTEETKTESGSDSLEGVPGEAVTTLSGKHNPDGFSVGFARFDITPEMSVPLGGFGNYGERFSTHAIDQIYLTCTAISDGEETLLLFSCDSMDSSTSVWKMLSKKIEKELGIPQKNIIINATHTHSSISLSASTLPGMTAYMQKFYNKALECAKTAVADLDKATVKMGRAYTEQLNYIRRYLLANGTYKTNPSSAENPIAHESEVDNEMQILYFDRENQKDVVLMNWQSHYAGVGTATSTIISADWVCGFRRNTETKLDVYAMFLQGAAGDVIAQGKLPGETSPQDGTSEWYINHGAKISDTLIAAIPNLKIVEPGKIQAETRLFPVTKREGAPEGGDDELPISVLSFGPVSFATTPYEMTNVNGKELKAATPFDMTFVCGYTNGSNSYVPADDSFPHGGYEVSKCHYVQGTAEAVVEELLTMLNAQHNNL